MSLTQTKKKLNEQIQEMLDGLNLPEEVGRAIREGIAELKTGGAGQGLAVGQKAPEFRLLNQSGQEVSLSKVLARGPAVLKFVRGEWCPICNLDVAALQRILPQLLELGATLLVITPQKPGRSIELQDRHSLGYDILSDEKQGVIRAFNLQFTVPSIVQEVYKGIGLNLPEHTADGTWNLPVPATFVLDREGVILASHLDVDYTQRMEPEEIIEAIRLLAHRTNMSV